MIGREFIKPIISYGREKTVERVEWIIATKEKPAPHPVEFEHIFKLRPLITSLTLLWDTNSYHVDVLHRQFIVNGGRRISIAGFEKSLDVQILAVQRHTQQVSTMGGQKNVRPEIISYLIGFEGTIEGEEQKKQVFLHISPDGGTWMLKNKR